MSEEFEFTEEVLNTCFLELRRETGGYLSVDAKKVGEGVWVLQIFHSKYRPEPPTWGPSVDVWAWQDYDGPEAMDWSGILYSRDIALPAGEAGKKLAYQMVKNAVMRLV